MTRQQVPIRTPYITLGDFLKWAGAVETGGEAKTIIQSGEVRVNGEGEVRRGRKLFPGDQVDLRGGGRWEVTAGTS